MGLFDKLLGNKENNEQGLQWNILNSIEELDELISKSNDKKIAVFKHSTRCSISSMAKSRIERDWTISSEDIELYYLDLIALRPVSNYIAEALNVHHESPQLIVFEKGKAIYNASHNSISAAAVQELLTA